MNITIMSRSEVVIHSCKDNIDECIIISISSRNQKKPNIFKNHLIKDILYLNFDDIEEQTENGVLMNYDDAVKIKEFVDKWKDGISNIVVHCQAGISRSAGVAFALKRVLNNNLENCFKIPKFAPNMLCYKTTLKGFGIYITDEECEKLRNINQLAFNQYMEEDEDGYFAIVNKMIVKE